MSRPVHDRDRRNRPTAALPRHIPHSTSIRTTMTISLQTAFRRRVTRAALLTVATCVSSLSSSLTAQATPLREFLDLTRFRAASDSFVVLLRGEAKGWQKLSSTADGASWTVGDALAITGMGTQSSSIRLDARLEQQALRQEGMMMGKPMKITLDWHDGRITGRALTPSHPAGELAIDVAQVPGLVDDNAVTPLLAYVRWREGLDFTFPVIASGKGTLSAFAVKVLDSERVTVPAGEFDTWRIQLTMDRSRMIANVTKSAPYRVVRMSNGPMFEVQLVK